MKKKNFSTSSSINFHSVIRDEKSVEDYFYKYYKLKYLDNLKNEKYKKLTNSFKKDYPNMSILKPYQRIEKMKDKDIKKAMKEEIADIKVYDKNGKMIPQEKIKVIDLILLKEYQLKYEKEIEEKTKIILEKHQQKSKEIENIADRILGNNEIKSNDIESLKDINELGKYLKEEIELEEEIGINNYINVKEIKTNNIGDNNFCLGAIYTILNNEGIKTVIEKKCKNKKVLDATLQLISSGLITNKKYDLKLDYGNKENEKIFLDQTSMNEFKNEFKKKMCDFYNISENNIIILDITKGSVNVNFTTNTDININRNDLNKIFGKQYKDITEKALFEGCKISEDLLDPRGNNFGNGYEKRNFLRGGEIYDPPYEWHGYGLRVLNNYDNGNNDWIGCNNKINEWAVAYHGIGKSRGKYDNVFKNTLSIVENNLSKGIRQLYKNNNNIREKSRRIGYEKCGEGVYLTPIIKEADCYAQIENLDNKKFKIVIMCRVNPKMIREPDKKDKEPYWILNGNSNEIRPYRILIKEI